MKRHASFAPRTQTAPVTLIDDGFCAGFRMPAWLSHPHAPAAGVRKAPRHEIAGGWALGCRNLSAGYGDLMSTPVAGHASEARTGGSFDGAGGAGSGVRRREPLLAGGQVAGFEQAWCLLRRAPAQPGQAQQQSRSILRFGNGDNGVMRCRSKPVQHLAAGTGAWSRGRTPR